MLKKANNIIRIPTSLESNFFKYWLDFLKPFHNLTNKEIKILACILKHRYNLSKMVTDNQLLDKITMSNDTKKVIKEECGLTSSHYQVIMSNLRRKKIIINNSINPKFIPNIKEEKGVFVLSLLFDLQ